MGKPKARKSAGKSANLPRAGAAAPPRSAWLDRFANKTPWLVLGLWVLAAATFGRVLANGFLIYDDRYYVTGNIHVQQGLTWTAIHWAFSSWRAANWHPLTWLSHILDFQLFGLRPWGHHLTSLLLHAANTSLVFLVLRRLTGAVWRSLLAAALFGVHPLRVESVAWVAERKDVLSTLFWLLSLWAYARFARPSSVPDPRRHFFYALSLGGLALGLMSKPMLVTAPFLLLLLDYWPLRRWASVGARQLVFEKAPFFLLVLLSAVVTFLAQRAGNAVDTELPFGIRAANALIAIALYLGKLFFPVHLAVLYPYPVSLPLAEIVGAGLLVLGLSIFTFRQRGVRPYLWIGWAWFVGTLVPVLGLVQVGAQSMADRYTYVPAIGILLALVWWGTAEMDRLRWPEFTRIGIAVALLAVCGVLSFRQIGYWKNNGTLFEHALAVAQPNEVAYGNLADFELDQGHLERAIELYRQAVRLQPAHPGMHGQLGAALCKAGQLAEGIRELQLAIQKAPELAQPHADLGQAWLQSGQVEEALREMEQSVNLSPDAISLRDDLGVALERNGRLDQAIFQLREVIRLFPSDMDAHVDLGLALEEKGRLDEAVTQYRLAVALEPGNALAHFNLGIGLESQGHVPEAIAELQQGLKLNPNAPQAHNELGMLLGRQQRVAEAVHQFREAIRLQPDYAAAQSNLSLALKFPPPNGPAAARPSP